MERNYKVTTLIPARKKAEFFRDAEKAENKKAIVTLSRNVAVFYAKKHNLNKDDEKTLILSLFASGLCVWCMKHAKDPYEYIINYIIWKQRISERLNDLGAFADGIETACHLINCREIWRVNLKNIHVSAIGNTDLQIKGVKYEIGINGKTWADSTENDAMNGPFDGVIYGAFDDATKNYIINCFRHNNVIKGLSVIAKNLYVFPDKNVFYDFMQNVGRSSSIAWKKGLNHYQTIYNPSKHAAFIKKARDEKIITFYDFIRQYGENDFLMD